VHRGGRGQSFVYELLHDGGGADGRPHLSGLVDVATLAAAATTGDLVGPAAQFEGPSGGHRAPVEGASGGAQTAVAQGFSAATAANGAPHAPSGLNGSGSHAQVVAG